MLQEWLDICIKMSTKKPDFYAGHRKILSNQHFTFTDIKDDLNVEHCGYTQRKISLLKKLYYHEESIEMAKILWDKCNTKRKYASSSFHCYNHLLKGQLEGGSKRASKMGPCIQAVSLSWCKKPREEPYTTVDCFYRTTELYKKFPADLIFLRDYLLPEFDFSIAPLKKINFHFANVTVHPMYAAVPLTVPKSREAIRMMEDIKMKDRDFYDRIVKLTARYICDEYHRGIEKHAQTMMVKKHADKKWKGKARKRIANYLRENHPGYRSDYIAPEKD